MDPAASAGGAVGTMGVMLASRRGHGCTAHALHSTGGAWRVCVSSTEVLADGVVAISDHETPTWALPGGALPLLRRQCCGSLCKYALVAMGAADAFFQHPVGWASKLKTWDHAAGVACVEAAGGRVTGFAEEDRLAPQLVGSCADDALSEGLLVGREMYPARGGVCVSNGAVHTEALRAVNAALDASAEGTREVLPAPAGLLMVDRDGAHVRVRARQAL